MLLLVTDTSGKDGFVALARAREAESIQVVEEVPLSGGTFSAQLVPQISGLLQKHGFHKTDIGAFIVVAGPGSFTGLRVGLAAIKALAEILHKPIVPVSLLEVVAIASGAQGEILSALDAGRGEVYCGSYDVDRGLTCLREERLLSKDEFFSLARSQTGVTPDPNLVAAGQAAGVQILQVERIGADIVARVGRPKLDSGEIVAPEQLEANYVRHSDEIFSKPASGS